MAGNPVAQAHLAYLRRMGEAHRSFLQGRGRLATALATAGLAPLAIAVSATPPEPVAPQAPEPKAALFDRADLEQFATGAVSPLFGPEFAALDTRRRRLRLPAPPFLLIDRVVRLTGAAASLSTGEIWTETDVQAGDWYLDEHGRMPTGILTESGHGLLMLLSWLGFDLSTVDDRVFRLLGYQATQHAPLPAAGQTVQQRIRLTRQVAHNGTQIFLYQEDVLVDGRLTLTVREGQAGLFTDAELRGADGLQWDPAVATPPPARELAPAGRYREPLPSKGELDFLDEITAFEPDGGPWGRGYLRARTRNHEDLWFYRVHFTNDPCMPGNLMLEGCLQAMAAYLHAMGFAEPGARFELAHGEPIGLMCRGQAEPRSREVVYEVFVAGRAGPGQPWVRGDVLVTVDGMKAMHLRDVLLRLVPGQEEPGEEVLDPEIDTWLTDHSPTWTTPALPMMSVLDRLTRAAAEHFGSEEVVVRDLVCRRWLVVGERTRLRTRAEPTADGLALTLLVWRQARTEALSRFEPIATATAHHMPAGTPPPIFPALAGARDEPDPYASGAVFHGPAFQYLTALRIGPGGASARLDAARGQVPLGHLHQGLLDAVLHAVPSQSLWRWDPSIRRDQVSFPHRIAEFRRFGPLPESGEVLVEARFTGTEHRAGRSLPTAEIQAIAGGRVLVSLRMVFVLLSVGALAAATPAQRRAFLRDLSYVDGFGLSAAEGGRTLLRTTEVDQLDWLPGTLARLYRLPVGAPAREHQAEIAVKDHLARQIGVHPREVEVAADLSAAHPVGAPERAVRVLVSRDGDLVTVRNA